MGISNDNDIVDGEWRDDNGALMVTNDARVLARLGSPDVQRAALRVLAKSLGVPDDAWDPNTGDPDLMGEMARAIQLAGEYGLMPGDHFHAVKRNVNTTINGRDVKRPKWTVQVGEKAWREFARRMGLNYVFQDREMTPDELREYATSMGMSPGDIHEKAKGVYSRVIQIEHARLGLVTDTSPIWVGGAWTGKIKQGRGWWNDDLPTGVTPLDVAIRRAHKRALMTSIVTPTPLDARPTEERYRDLTRGLIAEAQQAEKDARESIAEKQLLRESDGDVLFENPDPYGHKALKAQEQTIDTTPEVPPYASWDKPTDAYAFAVECGGATDVDNAREVFKEVVIAYGGAFNSTTKPIIYEAYHRKMVGLALDKLG